MKDTSYYKIKYIEALKSSLKTYIQKEYTRHKKHAEKVAFNQLWIDLKYKYAVEDDILYFVLVHIDILKVDDFFEDYIVKNILNYANKYCDLNDYEIWYKYSKGSKENRLEQAVGYYIIDSELEGIDLKYDLDSIEDRKIKNILLNLFYPN